ncbi:MAG TPA: hypothetical protein VM124_00990 [Candidatus Limnocylindrales bacterium]|nr:hypothetical protein [Candidatus Limnocylindrales bacterium]
MNCRATVRVLIKGILQVRGNVMDDTDNDDDKSLEQNDPGFTEQHGVPATPPADAQPLAQDTDTLTDPDDEQDESSDDIEDEGGGQDNDPSNLPGTTGQGIV